MADLKKNGKKLQDNIPVTNCGAICVQVDNLDMLESITSTFLCSTAAECWNEAILDCVHIEEEEDRTVLRQILKIPEDTELPTEGLIVFWT